MGECGAGAQWMPQARADSRGAEEVPLCGVWAVGLPVPTWLAGEAETSERIATLSLGGGPCPHAPPGLWNVSPCPHSQHPPWFSEEAHVTGPPSSDTSSSSPPLPPTCVSPHPSPHSALPWSPEPHSQRFKENTTVPCARLGPTLTFR